MPKKKPDAARKRPERCYVVSWGVTCAFSAHVDAANMAEAKAKAKEMIEDTHESAVQVSDTDATLDEVFLDKIMVERR